MGSHRIALPLLDFLSDSSLFQLTGVVSQPDRRSGRGQHISSNAVVAWANQRGISVNCPEKPSVETVEWMRNQGCDLILVMAYGHILGKSIRELPPLGIYNLHASLLPRFRGAAPIEAAIASGENYTGVSLMEVVKAMDAGDVFDTRSVAIETEDNSATIVDKLSYAARDLIKDNGQRICDRNLTRSPQDIEKVTYCRKIDREDSFLDFNQPAKALVDRIRALTPKPGCVIVVQGQNYKIESYEWIENVDLAPGTIFKDKHLCVACGNHEAIIIRKIQKPNGKMLPADLFLNGDRVLLQAGKVDSWRPMKTFESKIFPF